ncbi:MAG TPA: FecR domain-containing protein [Asticcacaulis sp.]|nr:FecR domain-containing protein [Asticcacaulis sp.]
MHNLQAFDDMDREEAAAYWVMAMSGPDVPAHRERLFETWISADPDNAMAYADCLACYDSAPVQEAAHVARAKSSQNGYGVWGGALAASLALVVIGGGLWADGVRLPGALATEKGYTQTLETTPGQILTARLPDGSQVVLNGDTQLSVHFAGRDRAITLKRGEAYFDIAHDATRPFTIEAADSQVRVLGTAFNIDLLPGGGAEVAVYRGRVRVEAHHESRDLGVGERVMTDGALTPVAFDVAEAPDWQGGWFEADNISLARLVGELNRFSAVPVRIDAPDLAARKVSGRFKVSDTDRVLGSLKQVYGVRIKREENVIVLTKSL